MDASKRTVTETWRAELSFLEAPDNIQRWHGAHIFGNKCCHHENPCNTQNKLVQYPYDPQRDASTHEFKSYETRFSPFRLNNKEEFTGISCGTVTRDCSNLMKPDSRQSDRTTRTSLLERHVVSSPVTGTTCTQDFETLVVSSWAQYSSILLCWSHKTRHHNSLGQHYRFFHSTSISS